MGWIIAYFVVAFIFMFALTVMYGQGYFDGTEKAVGVSGIFFAIVVASIFWPLSTAYAIGFKSRSKT
jgi:hypothetical protein